MSTVLHRNPARAEANGDYEFTEPRKILRIQVYRANSGNPGTVTITDTDLSESYSFSAACLGVSEPNLTRGWQETMTPRPSAREWQPVILEHFTISGLLAGDNIELSWTQL